MTEHNLHLYLEDLESRIDPDVEERLIEDWVDYARGRYTQGLFLPARRSASPSTIEWPTVSVNCALDDVEAMAIQQYAVCLRMLNDASGLLMCVRANYGTSILPSLFGAELFVMEESLDTLPTSRPLPGGVDAIKSLLDKGVPDAHNSLGGKALRATELFVEIGRKYPDIGRYVHVYHPDIQGPMDVCELLVGSELFTIICDHPDLVKSLLDLITETYIAYMRKYLQIVPPQDDHAVHWSMLHRGRVMLRNDSAMNFSPAIYTEFIRSYDQRIFDEFGGGAIHFCGVGDHYIGAMSEMNGLYAIAMSQPEMNDMEKIFSSTVDNGIALIGLQENVAREALARGRDLHGRVQSFRS